MSENVTADLIRKLVDALSGPSVDWDGWASMAMILEFPEGKFNEAHGYLYSPDGTISAVASDPWVVAPAVKAYTDSYYQAGEAMPLKILVELDRPSGKYNVTFEDTDESRWKMTPKNRKVFREELRPKLN